MMATARISPQAPRSLTWADTAKVIPRIFRDLRQPVAVSGLRLHTLADRIPCVLPAHEAFLLDLRGAPGRIRTCDTRFRKPMLYPLSYEGARA